MRRITPAEIAKLMTEDQYGNPDLTQMPVSPAVSPGPRGDTGRQMPLQQVATEVRACNATGCSYNEAAKCTLEAITVNDQGGCADYEATGEGRGRDEGRYEEEPSDDVTGGAANPAPPYNGTWDPSGGGY